ncbi:hypothetical protein TNCV_856351 [Trichonephila clavipes]|nr:hypothetical protein TNCV_856351 [Trichonephila clavipes]
MSQRSHLTDSEAWRVAGRLEGGQTLAEVAQAIGVSQSVISKIWNHFLRLELQAEDQDKAPRRANMVEDFLFEEGIVRMEWPACSPDMNPKRARLGRSMKTSCWPQTTPTNSPRSGKSSSGKVVQNTPTRD